MVVDPLRHLAVFDPNSFGQRRVDVIGAGATGSRVVMDLAKLGIRNIHVRDFDKVEGHNVANQLFGLEHIGRLKVEALQEMVKGATGLEISIHPQRVDGSTSGLGEIVFLLTDTMSSRRAIWEGALKFQLHMNLVIETRMGADLGRIYTLNPSKPEHVEGWESTFYRDDEAQVSACGASVPVGATAEIIAGLAVFQLIRWFAIENGAQDELDQEILLTLRPLEVMKRRF